jgi:hypothetical protein
MEVPGNDQGVWVVGNARSAGSFSATVKLLTTVADFPNACAYASNFPPVGEYITATKVSFTGTPIYKIMLKETGGAGTLTEYADALYTIRSGYTIQSFTDATGAPGTFHCAMPATQTLVASAAGYCESSAAVHLALQGTQSGVTYQLYRDNALLTGATLNGTGSAATFSGTFAAGVYRAESLPGAACAVAMNGAHTITMYPLPAPPIITGPAQACNSATLVAVPGDHGNGIRWTDNSSTINVRTITSTNTYTAITTSPEGCQSSARSFACTISQPSGAGSAPNALCGCSCGLTCISGICASPATTQLPRTYHACTTPPLALDGLLTPGVTSQSWSADMTHALCVFYADCSGLWLGTVKSESYSRTVRQCSDNHCMTEVVLSWSTRMGITPPTQYRCWD